jgi:hypothetical protein
MANSSGAPDPEQQKNELVAAIKAARELGPDMDQSVAASYLAKQQAAAEAARPQPQQAVVPTPGQQRRWPLFVSPPLGIMVYIVLLVVSHGALWWMFWLIPAIGGWGWQSSAHHEAHVQRHMDRLEWRRARYAARHGYSPYGSAPPANQPPQALPPQAPAPGAPQTPPSPQSTEYD